MRLRAFFFLLFFFFFFFSSLFVFSRCDRQAFAAAIGTHSAAQAKPTGSHTMDER